MRYLFITFVLVIGIIVNSILLFTNRSIWEIGSILLIDIGLIMGMYTIKIHYWTHTHLVSNSKAKIAAGYVIWLGLLFTYMGIHVWISGEYHLEGSRARTELYRNIMNSAGDLLGPWAVAFVWFALGIICIYYGWKGYRNA